MKKYKLLKWYPGCGKTKEGDVIEEVSKASFLYKSEIPRYYYSKSQIENSPEYWGLLCDKCNKPIKKGENITFIKTDCVCNKKVIEKDYEILSYIDEVTKTVCNIVNGKFLQSEIIGPYFKVEDAEDELNFNIHSIKRLSDGELFTVDDKICKGIITSFSIRNKYILDCEVNHNKLVHFPINKISNIKKPLFTTEDGVDIFEGDEYHNVNSLFNCKLCKAQNKLSSLEWNTFNILNNNKTFSTKEAAEEFIDSKKPTFIMTTEDGKKLYSNMTETLYGVTLSPAHVDDTILTKEFKQGVGDFRGWRKWFYDTGAAEEYLLYNKPVLSLMDVAGIYVTANPNRKTPIKYRSQRDRLLKLIKSKLYGKDK
tara:strand:- start:63694 stop:64797 length:1104 start_codon:yes stop_codon:yes gene_type:complete